MSDGNAIAVMRRLEEVFVRQRRKQSADALGAPGDEPRMPASEQFADVIGRVADEEHVAAGRPGSIGPTDDISGHAGALHRQVVAENDAIESQIFPQIALPVF